MIGQLRTNGRPGPGQTGGNGLSEITEITDYKAETNLT